RSAFRHFSNASPPASASTASTPSGANRRAWSSISTRLPSTTLCAHLPNQFYPFLARCGRKYLGAAEPCELHRKRPHASRGAVNDDGLALFQTQRIVNALQRGQARDRDRAG